MFTVFVVFNGILSQDKLYRAIQRALLIMHKMLRAFTALLNSLLLLAW